jgi:UDP-N-acetyl-D-mannosaminuronate dehydrogenase
VIPVHSLEGMDATIVITDHAEFKGLDWLSAAAGISNPVLVDGRFILPPNPVRTESNRATVGWAAK